jgi:hypothetical protein
MAAAAVPLQAQSRFGFQFDLGYTGLAGDYGKVLDGGWVAEFNVDYQARSFRYGFGFEVASLDVEAPFEEESVSKVGAHLSAIYLIPTGPRIKPFLGLRIGSLRLRPEGETFAPEPEPLQQAEEDGEEGENPAPRVDGFEGAAIGGLEIAVSRKVAFQVAGLYSYMKTDEVDLSAIDLGFVDKGTSWSLRASVRWKP